MTHTGWAEILYLWNKHIKAYLKGLWSGLNELRKAPFLCPRVHPTHVHLFLLSTHIKYWRGGQSRFFPHHTWQPLFLPSSLGLVGIGSSLALGVCLDWFQPITVLLFPPLVRMFVSGNCWPKSTGLARVTQSVPNPASHFSLEMSKGAVALVPGEAWLEDKAGEATGRNRGNL
jgi:hypothetical protein